MSHNKLFSFKLYMSGICLNNRKINITGILPTLDCSTFPFVLITGHWYEEIFQNISSTPNILFLMSTVE